MSRKRVKDPTIKDSDVFVQKPLNVRFDEYVKNLRKKDAAELLDLASDVAGNLADAAAKPTPFNLIKCGINIWKTMNDNQVYAEEYFRGDWTEPFNECFNEFIVSILQDLPCKIIRTSEEERLIKIAQVGGEEIGWIYQTTSADIQGVYVRKDRKEEARAALKQAQWDKVQHRYIVMEKIPGKGDYSESIHFKKDEDIVGLSSEKADEYSKYLKRCMDANVSRTILFYGPPGTGKSTIARAIADRLDLRTLRIRVEDIGSFDNTVIFEAVDIFKPDAIILDDLDRAHQQTHLLETMDRFHKHLKLVFATVNHQDQLDDALLRPGRFDEVVKIRRLDDIVVKGVLGEGNLHMFEQMKDWPVAFVQEYVTRRRFMSEEEALLACKELTKRVNKLRSYDDEDEDDEEEEVAGSDDKSEGEASDSEMASASETDENVSEDQDEDSEDSEEDEEEEDEDEADDGEVVEEKVEIPLQIARLMKKHRVKFTIMR
jgi:DNA replication protein DnaC